MKKNPEEVVIQINMARSQISSKAQLANVTGIKLPTLNNRFRAPGLLRLYEIREIIRATGMPDADIVDLVRGYP